MCLFFISFSYNKLSGIEDGREMPFCRLSNHDDVVCVWGHGMTTVYGVDTLATCCLFVVNGPFVRIIFTVLFRWPWLKFTLEDPNQSRIFSTADEQSGALHMFTSCLANFALPTLPQSSLGAQSSCSRILRLSTVPPIDPAVSPTPTQCPTS